jgi:hypothetical protein
MNAKDQFLSLGNFRLQSGNQIRFWKDKCLGCGGRLLAGELASPLCCLALGVGLLSVG